VTRVIRVLVILGFLVVLGILGVFEILAVFGYVRDTRSIRGIKVSRLDRFRFKILKASLQQSANNSNASNNTNKPYNSNAAINPRSIHARSR
jgi:hypothetical protein